MHSSEWSIGISHPLSQPASESSLCPGSPHCTCFYPLLSNHLCYQIDSCSVAVLVFQSPLLYFLIIPQSTREVMLSTEYAERKPYIECIHRKKHNIYRVWYDLLFQASTGHSKYPPRIRGRGGGTAP